MLIWSGAGRTRNKTKITLNLSHRAPSLLLTIAPRCVQTSMINITPPEPWRNVLFMTEIISNIRAYSVFTYCLLSLGFLVSQLCIIYTSHFFMEYYFYRYYKLPNREFVQLNEEANLQRDRLSV